MDVKSLSDVKKFLKSQANEVAWTLWLDAQEEPDFFWVFVGRTLYYLSVSCQSFLFYYVRDVIGLTDESVRRFYVGLIVLLWQIWGALTWYPAGQCSNRPGVGRKKLIYLWCAVMAGSYAWYLYIPTISTPAPSTAIPMVCSAASAIPGPGGSAVPAQTLQVHASVGSLGGVGPAHTASAAASATIAEVSPGPSHGTMIYLLMLWATVYGVWIGCYMSVDYWLWLDCLPKNKGPSEWLGLWGISGFIGSYIGPMWGGALLEIFGATDVKEAYSYFGYAVLLGFGGAIWLLSGLVTCFIKKAK